MALKIGIASFVSAGYTNPVIWRLTEDFTGVLVDTHSEPGPHGVVYNFVWTNGIRDVAYRISLYDQPGGTGTGVLIKSHVVTPSTSTLTIDADIETIVDGLAAEDPVSGTSTSPIIAALVGKDYSVQQRGIGQLRAVRDVEIIVNVNGSYTLQGGNTFNSGDTLIIKIKAQFVVNPPGTIPSSFYTDIVLLGDDYNIDPTDFGKLFIVEGNSSVVVLTCPLIADMPNKSVVYIENISSSRVQVVVEMQPGETVWATGTPLSNTFIISRASGCKLVKLGSIFYATTDDQDIRRRGQVEWGYSVGINRLWADGTQYSVADFPGLKKAMDAMEVGTVVTYAQWNFSQVIDGKTVYPYKGFYALNDAGTSFRVPDLRNKSIRALNGTGTDTERITQGPGGYQYASRSVSGLINENIGLIPLIII